MLHAICRLAIANLFNLTFFFSFLFRTVLIRFADRGLVDKGRPNTGLFNKLYWTILLTYCSYTFLLAPLISVMQGRYGQTIVGKICLLRPHKSDDFMYQRVGPMTIGVFIPMFFCKYLNYKSLRFIRGICPNNRMSSIGNYRRNLLTLEDTYNYFLYFSLWECCATLLMNFTYINPVFLLSPATVAAIHDLSHFIFVGFFYGFVLPMRITVPWNPINKPKDNRPFYVRQEKLEPRRPPFISREEDYRMIHLALSTSTRGKFGPKPKPRKPLLISREDDYHRIRLAMSTSSRGKFSPTTKKKGKIKYSLESYNQTAPSSEPVFLCDECDYACAKEITLKKHVKRKHQEAKTYSDNQEFSSKLNNTDTLITVVTMDTVTCSCTEEDVCEKCLNQWASEDI